VHGAGQAEKYAAYQLLQIATSRESNLEQLVHESADQHYNYSLAEISGIISELVRDKQALGDLDRNCVLGIIAMVQDILQQNITDTELAHEINARIKMLIFSFYGQ
jgi:hypothetical protein